MLAEVLLSLRVRLLHELLHDPEAGGADSVRLGGGLPGGGCLSVTTGTAHHTPTMATVILQANTHSCIITTQMCDMPCKSPVSHVASPLQRLAYNIQGWDRYHEVKFGGTDSIHE